MPESTVTLITCRNRTRPFRISSASRQGRRAVLMGGVFQTLHSGCSLFRPLSVKLVSELWWLSGLGGAHGVGEDGGDHRRTRMSAHFLIDMLEVSFDGEVADKEAFADFLVGIPSTEALDHVGHVASTKIRPLPRVPA